METKISYYLGDRLLGTQEDYLKYLQEEKTQGRILLVMSNTTKELWKKI